MSVQIEVFAEIVTSLARALDVHGVSIEHVDELYRVLSAYSEHELNLAKQWLVKNYRGQRMPRSFDWFNALASGGKQKMVISDGIRAQKSTVSDAEKSEVARMAAEAAAFFGVSGDKKSSIVLRRQAAFREHVKAGRYQVKQIGHHLFGQWVTYQVALAEGVLPEYLWQPAVVDEMSKTGRIGTAKTIGVHRAMA